MALRPRARRPADLTPSMRRRPSRAFRARPLATYLLQIAMLGGYLARNHNPPPGNMVERETTVGGVPLATSGQSGAFMPSNIALKSKPAHLAVGNA